MNREKRMRMHDTPTEVALAALTFWVAQTCEQHATAVFADLADREQQIVHRAAWLLVGHDPPSDPAAWPAIDSRQPLTSIFSRVQPTHSTPSAPEELFIRHASLVLQEAVLFPVITTDKVRTEADPVMALKDELQRTNQQQLAPEIRLERLLYALQRHAWCLPSPLDAVSLYDFARTHAAIAAARAVCDEPVFLLGGDLSGVQDFIYTLTAEGATKQLRGRSFYLQLLTEATAHYVLTQVHLPLTNLLYSGGGRFYLILPGTADDLVPRLRHEMGEQLLRRHGGTLYVALGGAMFPEHGDSQAAWQQVNDAINADKQRRFAALDTATLYQALFTPRQPALPPDVSDSDALIAQDDLNRSLEELAPRLHNTHYLEVQPRPPQPAMGTFTLEPIQWYRVLQEFGLAIRPVDATEVRPARHTTRLLAMQDRPDDEQTQTQTQIGTVGVLGTRYTVTVAPTATRDDVDDYVTLGLDDNDQVLRTGHVKPFNLLVAQSRGVKRLGVLRMDVDDLGDLFGQRLQRASGIAGLAYTAALSAALSHFFEGWVGERCRQINNDLQRRQQLYTVESQTPDRGSVYAIYSGGDDLFIVGSWHLLPGLAATIRNDFVRYTTGREAHDVPVPPITVSAGITLHSAKFPLYQAADEAHAALEAAKSYTRSSGGRKKDAICFLGQVVGWEDYAEVHKMTNTLLRLDRQGAPRALLMTLQSLYTHYTQGRDRHRTHSGAPQFAYGPWVWQGAYMLTRLVERTTGDQAKADIIALRDRIVREVHPRPFIEHVGLAARWTQLLIRNRKDERWLPTDAEE
jgi:CRISPR-associated protein Csm1